MVLGRRDIAEAVKDLTDWNWKHQINARIMTVMAGIPSITNIGGANEQGGVLFISAAKSLINVWTFWDISEFRKI